jgi:hypothetical protein
LITCRRWPRALRVTVGLAAVDGPAEALAIFGPQGERIHTR